MQGKLTQVDAALSSEPQIQTSDKRREAMEQVVHKLQSLRDKPLFGLLTNLPLEQELKRQLAALDKEAPHGT